MKTKLLTLLLLFTQFGLANNALDKKCNEIKCKTIVNNAYKVLYGTVNTNTNQITNTIDALLKELYGDYWLKVYVQHDRNYCALAKRIDATLNGGSELICYE